MYDLFKLTNDMNDKYKKNKWKKYTKYDSLSIKLLIFTF